MLTTILTRMPTASRDNPVCIDQVGFVGYGEVGQALAQTFLDAGVGVTVLTRSPERLRERLTDEPIDIADSHRSLAEETELVISCVWPATAVTVAEQVAPGLTDDQPYLDLNSIAPETTDQIVNIVDEAGGTPLKAVIMGSAAAGSDNIRLVLAGAEREATIKTLSAVGFTVEDAGDNPMYPAAIKLFRSLFTKGLRQLAAETLAPAAAYGLHEEVLADLNGLFAEQPLDEWLQNALENTPEHAERRLGELREVNRTVSNLGFHTPTLNGSIALHESLAETQVRADGYLAVLHALDAHLKQNNS